MLEYTVNVRFGEVLSQIVIGGKYATTVAAIKLIVFLASVFVQTIIRTEDLKCTENELASAHNHQSAYQVAHIALRMIVAIVLVV